MSKKASNTRHDIIIIVIDKLIIGAVIALLGLGAGWLIESHKSRMSFISEINKTRVQRIAEVWEKLYLYEARNALLYEQTILYLNKQKTNISSHDNNQANGLITTSNNSLSNDDRLNISLQSEYNDIVAMLNKNRFWIGEESYRSLMNYTKLINDSAYKRIQFKYISISASLSMNSKLSQLLGLDLKADFNRDNIDELRVQLEQLEIALKESRSTIESIQSHLLNGLRF